MVRVDARPARLSVSTARTVWHAAPSRQPSFPAALFRIATRAAEWQA